MSTSPFKDLFSLQAADYARFRPVYPPELYAWLAAQAPARQLAVDVGTGNGQAAIALLERSLDLDGWRGKLRARLQVLHGKPDLRVV